MAADTYTPLLGLLLQGTGNNNNSWGTSFNTAMISQVEKSIAGRAAIAVTGAGDIDYSGTPPPAAALQRPEMILDFTGTLTANQNIIFPNLSAVFIVRNGTTGSFALNFKTPTGSAQAIPQGGWGVVWCDGANNFIVGTSTADFAKLAKYRLDTSCGLVAGGGTLAYTLATNQVFTSLAAGNEVGFGINATNTGTTTLNVDGLGAKPLRLVAGTELVAGDLVLGTLYRATYYTSNSGEWLIQSKPVIAEGGIGTSKIADAAIALAKMANRATQTLLGRWSAGTGVPQEVTIGTGLALNASTGVLSNKNPAPPSGSFKSLSIKVASNTTITVAADFVTTTDGTSFQTTPVSSTINMAASVAVDALDTGGIAAASWYYIWVIAKADGTTKCIASLQSTANATFLTNLAAIAAGAYTFYARIGAVRTASGSANLMGTWQLGRKARYVLGLAQTTAMPVMASGAAGAHSLTTPTWAAVSVSSFVPTTASEISVIATGWYNSSPQSAVDIASNNSYGGIEAASPCQFANTTAGGGQIVGNNATLSLILESSNIYWASSSGGGAILCYGWEDNI